MNRDTIRVAMLVIAIASGASGEPGDPPPAGSPAPSTTTDRESLRAEVDRLVRAYHDLGQFSGVALVADEGEVVYEAAFGLASAGLQVPNTLETRFRVASITKAMTATLVLSLVDDDLLDLDAPIGAFVDGLRPDIAERVTTRQLLTHTSGLSQEYLPDPEVDRAYELFELLESLNRHTRFEAEPGATATYSNAGFVLLAAVAESVTGSPFAALMRERIFEPSGMSSSGLEERPTEVIPRFAEGYDIWLDVHAAGPTTNMSATRGNGGVYATAADVHRFVAALRSGRLISEERLDTMFTPGSGGFGMAWQIREKADGFPEGTGPIAWHRGANPEGFRTQVTLSLDRDRVIVLLANQSVSPRMEMTRRIHAILAGESAELPVMPPAIAIARQIRSGEVESATESLRSLGDDDAGVAAAAVNELMVIGHHMIRAGRPDLAVDMFEVCDAVYTDIPGILSSIAYALAEAGQVRAARAAVERCLAVDPANADAETVLKSLPAGS